MSLPSVSTLFGAHKSVEGDFGRCKRRQACTVPIEGLNLHAERCQGTLAPAGSERQDDHQLPLGVVHADRAGMTVNRRRADEMFLEETNKSRAV